MSDSHSVDRRSMFQEAMVLAAGKGTRLGELGTRLPKALVPIQGVPMLTQVLERLAHAQVSKVVVNAFHLAEQIEEFASSVAIDGLQVAVVTEDELLDTGGALKNAAERFGPHPVFIQNADVWTTLDIPFFHESHLNSGAVATLAGNTRTTTRPLLIDEAGELCGWRNKTTGEVKLLRTNEVTGERSLQVSQVEGASPVLDEFGEAYGELAFCGIAALNFPAAEYWSKFPARFWVFDLYFQFIIDGFRVQTVDISEYVWHDIGTPERIATLEKYLATCER